VGGGERTGAVVARGDADIAFQQISELLPVPGIAHITPLPPDVQKTSAFSAGVGGTARNPELARSVIRFLRTPEAAPAIRQSGLEVIERGSRA
jgi:molybdate transport system substrate-binding protein